MGADSKEACLFEDLELLCECGGGWRCVREGLEQVGELCRQEGELCRQQCGSLIRTPYPRNPNPLSLVVLYFILQHIR